MSNKLILLVEDETRVAFLLKQYLVCLGPGYQVETAASGLEALQRMETTTWDLVITDNRMPGLTGLELIERIKQGSPSTLTILMTAYGSEEVEEAARRLDTLQYMIKPFPMADLKRVILDAFESEKKTNNGLTEPESQAGATPTKPAAKPARPEVQTPQPQSESAERVALKVVLAGDGYVGKTTLLKRLCTGKFDASRTMTIGVDFHLYDIDYRNAKVRLIVWDVSGQDHFAFTRRAFYRGCKAAGLVYSVDNHKTFERLVQWRKEIRELYSQVPLILIGNKTDLARQVSPEEGQALAKDWNVPFFETSCASGAGVADFFSALAEAASHYAA